MKLAKLSLRDHAALLELSQAVETLESFLRVQPSPASTRFNLTAAEEEGSELQVDVPPAVVPLVVTMLRELANGRDVAVTSMDAELTTQQSADLLNVSRPFLIGLLESGEIPFRRTGNRRKVTLDDVLAYKRRDRPKRLQALAELTAESQALGLYD